MTWSSLCVSEPTAGKGFGGALCRRGQEDVWTWLRSQHRSLFQAFGGNETLSEDVSLSQAPAAGSCCGLGPCCAAVMELIYRLRWSHSLLVYRLEQDICTKS